MGIRPRSIRFEENPGGSSGGQSRWLQLHTYATGSLPTANAGSIAYDTTTSTLKYYNGSAWNSPTVPASISPAAGAQGLLISPAGAYAATGGCFEISASTGSVSLLNLIASGAYTGDFATINTTNAVAAKALNVTGAGTRTAPLVLLTDTPDNGGISLSIASTASNAAARSIKIVEAGTSTNSSIECTYSAAFAGKAISAIMTNAANTAVGLSITGAQAFTAAVSTLSLTGVPTATGRVVEVKSTGNAGAANVGICGRFLETGAAQATSYAVQIDSTNNNALNVSTGKSHFAGSVTFVSSSTNYQSDNYVTASGSNNAITVTLQDDTATNVTLAAGLRLTINLGTKTLQAGANTISLNGTVKNLTKHTNSGSNIGTAYAAGSIVDVCYDGTQWQDMGQ